MSTFRVRNAWPTAQGYRPMASLQPITAALPSFQGGASYVSSDGISTLLATSGLDLHRFNGSGWDFVLTTALDQWRFAQFGDRVIAVNGDLAYYYDLTAGTAGALPGSPPNSGLVATVRQQVFLAGDPTAQNTLAISGYNDSEGWTAGVNQCLYTPFPSGGRITGLAGGETGIILQERSIKRATYTGDVTVWQFDEISRDVGCMSPGSVAESGYLVFFLSEQGFKVCDRNGVEPIGAEKIDREFFSTYSRTDIINNMSAAVDPRTTTVVWCMPGNPGRLWAYNWSLGKWSTGDIPMSGVFSGFTSAISLEGVSAAYPAGIDSIPYSLDNAIFAGGNPMFLVADWNGFIGPLNGPSLEARFGVAPIELEQGRRVRMRGCRAVSDAIVGTVTVDTRARAGDPPHNVVSGAIRDNGRVPIRANGRHVGFEHVIPAGAVWTYARGLEVEYDPEGRR